MIENFNPVYFVMGLFTFLVLLYWKLLKHDTAPTSIFFTLDTSRTIRFLISYGVFIGFGLFGLFIYLPFLSIGLIFLVMVTFIVLVNGALVIFGLLSLLFGGDFPSLFDFEAVRNFLGNTTVSSLVSSYEDVGESYLLYFHTFLLLPIIGFVMTRYSEEKKSAFFAILFLTLYNNTILILFYDNMGRLNINEPLITFNLGTPFLGFFIASSVLKRKEDYFLPEVRRKFQVILMLTSFAIIVILSMMFFIEFVNFPYTSGSGITLSQITLLLFSIWFTLLIVKFFIEGDHDYEFRLSSIEIREDLLEEAREFRNLNEDNIEDFLKKPTTKMY